MDSRTTSNLLSLLFLLNLLESTFFSKVIQYRTRRGGTRLAGVRHDITFCFLPVLRNASQRMNQFALRIVSLILR